MSVAPGPTPILDRVVITTTGYQRELTVAEFFALPLSQRIRCVIERTATFYAADGREVDRQAALDALRVQRAGGSAA